MKYVIIILSSMFLFSCSSSSQKDGSVATTTAVETPKGGVSFTNLKDGDTVKSPFKVVFGITGMEVKPAGDATPNSGHHHLIIDGKPLPKGQVVPKDDKNLHFGKGQTEADVKLKKGKHKLTLQFADGNHMSYGEDWSKTISVKVK